MKIIKLTVLFMLVHINILFSQNVSLKEKIIDKEGKVSFAKPTDKFKNNSTNERALLQTVVQSENRIQFIFDKTITEIKATHHHYSFMLENIPIEGADYLVHSENDSIFMIIN